MATTTIPGSTNRVRIADVAAAVGVSAPTAACILRGDDARFKAETCERVLAAAKRLGYRANASARTIASGRCNAVGVVVNARDLAHSDLHQGFQTGLLGYLQGRGQRLVIGGVEPDESGGSTQLLREWSTDGLLVAGVPELAAVRAEARARGVPCIAFNLRDDQCCVHPDDEAIGRQAAELLLAAGHRRIGYLGPAPDRGHYSCRDRFAGVAAVTAAAGLPLVAPPMRPSHVDDFSRVLVEHADVTGWIAYGSQLTQRLALAMARRGWWPGRECSLVGLDLPAWIEIGLHVTTVQVPWYRFGAVAGEELLALIEQPTAPRPARAIAPELLEPQATVGAPMAPEDRP